MELIFFEVNDGECAGVLDEFTHERGVGLKWTAVDRFAAEGARGQGVQLADTREFFCGRVHRGRVARGVRPWGHRIR